MQIFNKPSSTVDQSMEAPQQCMMADSTVNSLITEKWHSCQESFFSVAEIGFGSGMNFLLSCLQFEQFLQKNSEKNLKRLIFTSFEKKPKSKNELNALLSKYIALNPCPKFVALVAKLLEQYPLLVDGCHRLHFDNITLDLWIGDFNETLTHLHIYSSGLFDCWQIDNKQQNLKVLKANNLIPWLSSTSKNKAILMVSIIDSDEFLALEETGFTFQENTGTVKDTPIHIAKLNDKKHTNRATKYTDKSTGQHYREGKKTTSKDVAIIGGGISSACLTLALINRGFRVTLYCKDQHLAIGASGNRQGALYPLLNQQHNALSQLFTNSFLYARNYVADINKAYPFDHDFSGLLQLYYDQSSGLKLDKIVQANLPLSLVQKVTPAETDKLANIDIGQPALYYPLAGWLSPGKMVDAIFKKAQQTGQLDIKFSHHLDSFEETSSGWACHFGQKTITHEIVALTTAMKTLDFEQSKALPLSAARGQVTHIESTSVLQGLKMTVCHEGYLTPINDDFHCMGATFKRHNNDVAFSQQEQIENKQKLAKCIKNKPWVAEINEQHQHANVGIRCTTRDHFPYVGALPNYQQTKVHYQSSEKQFPSENAPFYKNLFVLTGLGSRGLNTAPLLAETLASQINQEPLPLSVPILNALQCNRQWINYLRKGKKLKI